MCFESVLEVVDAALHSAAEAQKKTSEVADEKFQKAIKALCDYATNYPSGTTEETVAKRMRNAEEEDKSKSKFLSSLKVFPVREELAFLHC